MRIDTLDNRVKTQAQAGFAVISIQEASKNDTGEYTILAENEAGQAEASATIIVVPKISSMEASQIFDVEDAREIQFSASF